jgi:uncharacterized protein YdeI (BOF family)
MLRNKLKITELLKRLPIAFAAVLALGFGASAAAGDKDPYRMADNSWITISGEVGSVNADTFMLDYGDGYVIVEMDDGDRDADAYKLLKGDKVTVSGRVDDDFLETTKIEAGSVYVENIGTTFFSSSVDEETSEGLVATVSVPVVVAETVLQGTVTDVDEHEFTVDAGVTDLRVDVNEMLYNPLDDEGYQKIDVGDRVKVTGKIDNDLFEGKELMADSVIKLNRE